MKCYFAGCDCPATYFQLKAADKAWRTDYEEPGPKNVAFQACKAHGVILYWDLPETRLRHGVLTAEEFEVYKIHQE